MDTVSHQNETYFNPRRLGHTNLWAEDIENSMRFYRDVCGLNLEFSEPDLLAHFLGTGHTPHDLGMIQVTKGVPRYGRDGLLQLPGHIGLAPGLNHLAWELENEAELVAAYKKLRRDGIETDLTVDHQVAHSVYMFDPDGNYNEFYCDTVKDWRTVLSGEMELLTEFWDPERAEGFTEGRYDPNPIIRINESAPVHPSRITHAVLVTPQLDAMCEFYSKVGGLSVVQHDRNTIYLRPRLEDYRFALVLVRGEVPEYHHASFELADDETLDEAIRGLSEQSIDIVRQVDLPWKRSIFLRDPDGLQSEWYVERHVGRDLAAIGEVPLAYAV